MVNFAINNLTPITLVYNGVSILSGASYTVTSDHLTFIKETNLLPDLGAGLVTVTIGVATIFGRDAVAILMALSTNASVVYNSTLPTPSSGDRLDIQSNQFGELAMQFRNQYAAVTGNTTSTVKSGSGRLHGIMVNRNWTGGSVTIYDNTAGSGTVIADIDFGTPSGGVLTTTGVQGPSFIGPLGLEFSTGLTVVTSGSSSNSITILYQ